MYWQMKKRKSTAANTVKRNTAATGNSCASSCRRLLFRRRRRFSYALHVSCCPPYSRQSFMKAFILGVTYLLLWQIMFRFRSSGFASGTSAMVPSSISFFTRSLGRMATPIPAATPPYDRLSAGALPERTDSHLLFGKTCLQHLPSRAPFLPHQKWIPGNLRKRHLSKPGQGMVRRRDRTQRIPHKRHGIQIRIIRAALNQPQVDGIVRECVPRSLPICR